MTELAEWVERLLVGCVMALIGVIVWFGRNVDGRITALESDDAPAQLQALKEQFTRFEREAAEQRADVRAELRRLNDKLDTQQTSLLNRIDAHHATMVASVTNLVQMASKAAADRNQ